MPGPWCSSNLELHAEDMYQFFGMAGAQGKPRFVPNPQGPPSATVAARAALYNPSISTKPPQTTTSTYGPTSVVHRNGPTRLFTPLARATPQLVLPFHTAPSAVPVTAGQTDATAAVQASAHAAASSLAVAEPTAFTSAGEGVAELLRLEQQSDVGFKAAQDLEWKRREIEIERQAEESRRLKRERRAQKERADKQKACVPLLFCCKLHDLHKAWAKPHVMAVVIGCC